MLHDHWFDRFNRALTGSAPRRQVLRAIGGLVAGAALGAVPVSARKPTKKKRKKQHQPAARCGQQECARQFTTAEDIDFCEIKCGRCRIREKFCIVAADVEHGDTHATCCFEHHECCDGACVDTKEDIRHCGRCGQVCGAGELCIGGECVASVPCSAGKTYCPPLGCVDTRIHLGNCGGCGKVCNVGMLRHCVNGQCGCNPASDTVPCGINCIPRGYTCCLNNDGYGCSNPNAVCRSDGGCGAPGN